MGDTAARIGEEGVLIRRAQGGSEEAFCDLVRLHQGSIRAFLFRCVRDRAVMDDLAQETFLSAFRRLSTFKGESSLRVWLLGIARYCALKHLRDQQARHSRHAGLLESAVAGWRAQAVERRAEVASDPEGELRALRQCLDGLAPASAAAVTEFYFKHRPLSEVARSLGKGKSAMKMALLRIRECLRECVERKVASGGALP